MNIKALSTQMLERADADKLPADHAMRVKANALREVVDGFSAEQQRSTAPKLLGAWARARKVWCDYTGEPLT